MKRCVGGRGEGVGVRGLGGSDGLQGKVSKLTLVGFVNDLC